MTSDIVKENENDSWLIGYFLKWKELFNQEKIELKSTIPNLT